MLLALDIAFFVFHTLLILFNMFGWAFKATRKWHLLSVGLTAASWFVAGYWKGWGYCFCTDWHQQVRAARGIVEYDTNYLQLLARLAGGQEWSVSFAESLALLTFAAIIICTAWANWPRRRAAAAGAAETPA